MPKQTELTFLSAQDPNTIDFYIKRLMNCADALIYIKERRDCFQEAKFNATTKEMYSVYMLLDLIQELITEMRATNTCFKGTTGEGLRAIKETLPDYVIEEVIEGLRRKNGEY